MRLKIFILLAIFAFTQGYAAIHIAEHNTRIPTDEHTLVDNCDHHHDEHEEGSSCQLCDYAQSVNQTDLPKHNDFIAINKIQGKALFVPVSALVKCYQYSFYNPRSPPLLVS